MTEHPVMTLNQVVAANIAYYRKVAGLTQRELGARVGWSNVAVSEAERSRDGRLNREFDAADLGLFALALGIPLIALFLPPPDGGESRVAAGDEVMDAARVTGALIYPDNADDTPVMTAYRERFTELTVRYLATDPKWADLAARWLADMGERRTERASRFRSMAAAQREQAAELDELAAAVERRARE